MSHEKVLGHADLNHPCNSCQLLKMLTGIERASQATNI